MNVTCCSYFIMHWWCSYGININKISVGATLLCWLHGIPAHTSVHASTFSHGRLLPWEQACFMRYPYWTSVRIASTLRKRRLACSAPSHSPVAFKRLPVLMLTQHQFETHINEITILCLAQINTLRPELNGNYFADDIFKCISLMHFCISIKISCYPIGNRSLLVVVVVVVVVVVGGGGGGVSYSV